MYEESAYIISMRLKKLCEDKCGDMALNLTRCYLKCCDWAEEENLSMCISENQKKFVFDIYLSLLFQHAGTVEMSNLVSIFMFCKHLTSFVYVYVLLIELFAKQSAENHGNKRRY